MTGREIYLQDRSSSNSERYLVLTEDGVVIDGRAADSSVCWLSVGVWRSDFAQSVTNAEQLLLVRGSLGLSAFAEVWTQVGADFCFV